MFIWGNTLHNETDYYSKGDNQNFETSCLWCAELMIVLSFPFEEQIFKSEDFCVQCTSFCILSGCGLL
jgi:hypothetical protein